MGAADDLPLRVISNTSNTPLLDNYNPTASDQGAGSIASRIHSSNQSVPGSPPEFRTTHSFDSSFDRPTSQHNVSSPTSRSGNAGFLSVPGRTRENSVDSCSDEASFGSDTCVPSASASSAQGDKDLSRNEHIMKDKDALTPDPGTEDDFKREDNNFAFTPGELNRLINPKSLSAFYALGGPYGLEKGLRTDLEAGLSLDEKGLDGVVTFDEVKALVAEAPPSPDHLDKRPILRIDTTSTVAASRRKHGEETYNDRKRIFSDNRLPEKKGKSIFELMWITYNDKVLILLSVAAVVSLAVGLYQTFGTPHNNGEAPIEWVEGVAIIAAILIVVVVGSLNDYQKERQFVKLNKKKQDRIVNVVRSGKVREISIFDIVVGDIMQLEPGDMVPVDGIFIDGHNIKCDESQTTGESDLIKKKPAQEVYTAIKEGQDTRKMDPFILSGSHVTEGIGKFLVTSTGVNSSYGKIMMSLREDQEVTPLQSKLNTLAEYIAKLGGAAGLILFVVLFIQFLARLPHNTKSPSEKGQEFLNIFIVTVTIIVVAVPEGLPLAVTLALAFATTRMLKDNNLVRHLKACEVMGNATAICSDKTGTLTQNKMLVVAGTFGTSSRFGGTTELRDVDAEPVEDMPKLEVMDNIPAKEVVDTLCEDIQELLLQSIAVNSTAFEGEANGESTFIGSKTETALLIFAKEFLGMESVGTERHNAKMEQLIPFDSKRKCMGVVINLGHNHYRLLVKGASEILLEKCTRVIRDPTADVSDVPMTEENRKTLNNLIISYAERSLRTIGLVYKDFEQWPPKNARRNEGDPSEAVFEDVFKDMVLLSIVGIQDPLRDGVREAVEKCQRAGVVVRMVTGDNMITAKAIAAECGIYTHGGVVMEGPTFRRLSKKQMEQVIPSLQVLARSSPEDKRILVKRLKELGETVAVTGDGTNDAPALKGADVGFSMGIAGTEVAKEASAIILMDDNFASIVKAMMWGRAVNDAVKKFLQFQVTVNITAVVLTFVTAVSSKDETSALTAVQLLWVNLIMDTMAALALATDPPTPSILDRKPDPKSAPLITISMWKMIIGETIYQLAVTFLLYFGASSVFSYDDFSPEQNNVMIGTLVFNTFVWMQIFNQWK
jgi:Ca2+-transporting ATPase